jgi:hypothetical protein
MGAADFSLTPWQSLLFLLLFTLLLNIDNSTTTIEKNKDPSKKEWTLCGRRRPGLDAPPCPVADIILVSGWSIGLVTRRSWVRIAQTAKLSRYSQCVKLYAPTYTDAPTQPSIPPGSVNEYCIALVGYSSTPRQTNPVTFRAKGNLEPLEPVPAQLPAQPPLNYYCF